MNIIRKTFKPVLGYDADVKLGVILVIGALLVYVISSVGADLGPVFDEIARSGLTVENMKALLPLFSSISAVLGMLASFFMMIAKNPSEVATRTVIALIFVAGAFLDIMLN